MTTRRQALALGLGVAGAALGAVGNQHTQRTGAMDDMPRVFFYSPHADDETLSAGLALTWYIANGYDVHLVLMNAGGNGGPLGSFNGTNVCGWGDHAYTHNPGREGYPVLATADIAAARILEARSALGAMSTITPSPGKTLGAVYFHEGGLADGFGTTPTAVEDVKTIISGFASAYTNSFHHTMSHTDDHPDHAACGEALRQLKLTDPNVGGGSRFFVSRLYWNYATNPDVEAQPGLTWFNAGTRKAEYDALLRTRVLKAYSSWNPAGASYAVGYHQVVGQFLANYGPSATVANLWHA